MRKAIKPVRWPYENCIRNPAHRGRPAVWLLLIAAAGGNARANANRNAEPDTGANSHAKAHADPDSAG